MNNFDIASLLILAAFVWATWSVIRKPSRGSILAVTIIGIILGLDAGFTIAWRLYIPEMRSVLSNAYNSIAIDQLQTAMVSAAALTQLEDGKNDDTKSFLAERVARYYQELKSAKTLNAQQQKTLAIIEKLSSKSEILRQKLAEQTKQPKE